MPADPALLKIAITNLLSNAIKFVPQGVRPKITVSASVKENRCRIEINDNGIGIAEEDQQRIFMPFVRLYSEEQFPGIGLGLPSVRKAVELMGAASAWTPNRATGAGSGLNWVFRPTVEALPDRAGNVHKRHKRRLKKHKTRFLVPFCDPHCGSFCFCWAKQNSGFTV